MSTTLLIILGSCLTGVIFGLLVYWIFFRIPKPRRANQSSPVEIEAQVRLTGSEDIDQPLVRQEFERGADPELENENWLNKEISEVPADTLRKEDDDWLNAGLDEVPAKDYKKQDEDWLNARDNQASDSVNDSQSNSDNPPEVQIEQDGSILNIIVIRTSKKAQKPEKTVINLKINASPQDSDSKDQLHYDVEVSPSYQGLQDTTTVKALEESANMGNALMDEISVRPLESPVIKSHDSDS